MGDGPIQPVYQPATIDTMLNNNGLNISDGLNFVTCEQTFSVKEHSDVTRFNPSPIFSPLFSIVSMVIG